ncbi:hypothetical protein VL10_24040 [Leclercia adecarboxylata]|nr:hypothetical protein VL10_24040 [Leclercia adecarboxylata]KMN66749.1 hypothetical protein VK95_04480 [Leclercia sp. LK8]
MKKNRLWSLSLLMGFTTQAVASCDAGSNTPLFQQRQLETCKDPSGVRDKPLTENLPVLQPDDISAQKDVLWDAPVEHKRDADIQRVSDLVKQAKNYGLQALESTHVDNTRRNDAGGNAASTLWCVSKNHTLSENMRSWAEQAKWSINWLADYDYPLMSPFCVSGTFSQAISSVMSSYSNTRQPLLLDLYPRQALVIVSSKN